MEPIRIGNILIDQQRLAKLDRSRVVASIAHENFLSGEITLQRVCERPLILSVIAAAMISVGLLTVRGLVDWWLHGGTVYDVSIMIVLLLPGGLWLLREAWRQAPMIVIQTRQGTSRMEFKAGRTKESATDLARAAQQSGYTLRCAPGEWG